MKKYNSDLPGMLSLIAIVLTLVVSLYFTKKQERSQTHQEQNIVTENIKFICPVHSQVIQDVPGNCPICGASLVETKVEYNNNDTSLIGRIQSASSFLAQ